RQTGHVRSDREWLAVQRERAVRVPDNDRHVLEDEIVFVPPEVGDLVADLGRPLHVVVPDCPQVPGDCHGRGSASARARSAPSLVWAEERFACHGSSCGTSGTTVPKGSRRRATGITASTCA